MHLYPNLLHCIFSGTGIYVGMNVVRNIFTGAFLRAFYTWPYLDRDPAWLFTTLLQIFFPYMWVTVLDEFD